MRSGLPPNTGGSPIFHKTERQEVIHMSKLERFEVVLKEGNGLTEAGQIMILRDKETGVQYLWVKSGYAGGLSPLLDKDGKPLIG